jgi:hypothetical protein
MEPFRFYQAGNYGTGKRSGDASTLICAVIDDRKPDLEEEEEELKSPLFFKVH